MRLIVFKKGLKVVADPTAKIRTMSLHFMIWKSAVTMAVAVQKEGMGLAIHSILI